MLALDISFSAPNVTPEWCAARLAEGYELLWVDAWTGKQSPQGVEQALRTWREAGGYIGAYGCIHDGRPAAQHYASAKAAIGEEWPYLSFFAIDCEIDFCNPQRCLLLPGMWSVMAAARQSTALTGSGTAIWETRQTAPACP